MSALMRLLHGSRPGSGYIKYSPFFLMLQKRALVSDINHRQRHWISIFNGRPLSTLSLVCHLTRRTFASKSPRPNPNLYGQQKNKSVFYYMTAVGVLAIGMCYAAVPLYRIFCQAYSYGGTTNVGHDANKVETMSKVPNRLITVKFNADIAASLTWKFKPQQTQVKIFPGETALAFYTATNSTDRPITGISTYNVIPFEAGQYFNKIQCFCFEEQMLNPHEQVDMPVFFYIDPEFAEDPLMEAVDTITLSYTFFEAKPGFKLPVPTFSR